MAKREEIIKTLSEVDVSQYVEQKMGLNYLSWANAWAILTQYYPESTYEFKEYPEYIQDLATKQWIATGRAVDYRQTPAGCEVTSTVHIGEEDFTMSLYVMDNRNKVVPNPNYAQINKTQQRCLVKTLALAGLGLNLYQGEDLPTGENMKRKGINPEQQAKLKEQEQQLAKLKSENSKLLGEVAVAMKKPTSTVRETVGNVIKEQHPEASKMNVVEKFELMNQLLRNMLKEETGKNSEEMTFEEVTD